MSDSFVTDCTKVNKLGHIYVRLLPWEQDLTLQLAWVRAIANHNSEMYSFFDVGEFLGLHSPSLQENIRQQRRFERWRGRQTSGRCKIITCFDTTKKHVLKNNKTFFANRCGQFSECHIKTIFECISTLQHPFFWPFFQSSSYAHKCKSLAKPTIMAWHFRVQH